MKPPKTRLLSLLGSSVLLASPLASAATTITLTNADVGNIDSSVGTVGTVVAAGFNGTLNPSTVTYTISGLNLDDVGPSDTLTFTLNVVGIGDAPTSNGANRFLVGNNEINVGEQLEFTLANIVASTGQSTSYVLNMFRVRNYDTDEFYEYSVDGGTATTVAGTGASNEPTTVVSGQKLTFGTVQGTGSSLGKGQLDSLGFTITVAAVPGSSAVPEPSAAALLCMIGFLGLLGHRR